MFEFSQLRQPIIQAPMLVVSIHLYYPAPFVTRAGSEALVLLTRTQRKLLKILLRQKR